MKKIIAVTIALVLALSCVGALADLSFVTGGTGGVYYAYGNELALYVSNNSDVTVVAEQGNGSKKNILAVDMDEAQLGFSQNDVAYYAYTGIRDEDFEEEPITGLRALAALYTEGVQLVTCNPDIKSVEDLKGKVVSIGSAGSGVYFNAIDFLAAYGLTEDDIDPRFESFADSKDSLIDGKIDAAFVVAGAPASAVAELATAKQAYLVPLDAEHIAALKEICDVYDEFTIPAGTYEGIDEDILTVGMKALIVTSSELSDDEAYAIVSTIFEGKDQITHDKAKDLDLAYATTCAIPYHNGAAKYFAEKGIEVVTAD